MRLKAEGHRWKETIMSTGSAPRNVVLVHGAFVDGSGWRAVYDLLTQDGYHVAVAQNPTVSLQGDAAATRLVLDAQDGPVVLVGHSYGGAVITEAGTHDKVAALVYLSAFAPDKGESVNTLIGQATPGAATSPILPPAGGFLFQDRAKFYHSFGADLPAADAAFMADSQVPWGVDALAEQVSEPAWRSKPSWYLITTEDQMIPPPNQRAMAQRAGAAMVDVAASHAVYLSHPGAVAALIRQVRV
jgi:pimeloyl-ACP methyl ester carboxylesterase